MTIGAVDTQINNITASAKGPKAAGKDTDTVMYVHIRTYKELWNYTRPEVDSCVSWLDFAF